MKRYQQFTSVIQRDGDWYVAWRPELDIASQGRTVEEARRNLIEAMGLFCGEPPGYHCQAPAGLGVQPAGLRTSSPGVPALGGGGRTEDMQSSVARLPRPPGDEVAGPKVRRT